MTLLARDPRAPFVLTPPVMPLERRARGYDRPLTVLALTLSLIGGLLVWAATRSASGESFLYRHLLNLLIAAVLMVAASRLDARLLRLFGPVVYLASLFGLLLVIPAGTTVNGAKAWIRLGGGFELQPSEFMKLGLIVGMAVLFTRDVDREDAPPTTRDIVLALGLVAVPLGLIMLQPDLGSAMVLGCARFRSIPLFIDLRKEFGKSANKFFIYGDGGIHFAWLTESQKPNSNMSYDHFSNGFYMDAGVGYKVHVGRSALLLNLGYSYKYMTEETPGQLWFYPMLYLGGPSYPDSPSDTYSYHLNRVSIKIGWEF